MRRERPPSRPISGKKLPVLGNVAGATGVLAGAGGGITTATKIGASAGGAGGGGGIDPVTWL